ncbi:MAG TPA: hypothetical protein VF945_17245 [Polyangia bacterium]
MPEPTAHDAFVAAWMERVTAGRSQRQLVELLELALNALYASARTTLGDVTLAAIVDRILFTAARRHAFLAKLTFEAPTISCKKLLEQLEPPDEASTKDGLRFVIAEFLTVLGNLTAEILTPTFHAELSKLEKLPPHAQPV